MGARSSNGFLRCIGYFMCLGRLTLCALHAGVPPSGHGVQLKRIIVIPSLRSCRRLTGVTESQPCLGWLVYLPSEL